MNNCWNNASILPDKPKDNSISDILKVRLFNGIIAHGFYSFTEHGYIVNHVLFTDNDIVKEWIYA